MAQEPNNNFSFSPLKLQRIPHLTDYLPITDSKTFTNPLNQNRFFRPTDGFYIAHSDIVLRQIVYDLSGTFSVPSSDVAYLRAGPRQQIYFDPHNTRVAIVTCGGLCPGLNTVIRELVVGLWELYGVRQIYGIQAGYRGFYSGEPIQLNPKMVHGLHKRGGTVLETSRGGFDLNKIVDSIQSKGFNQVCHFVLSFPFGIFLFSFLYLMEYIKGRQGFVAICWLYCLL